MSPFLDRCRRSAPAALLLTLAACSDGPVAPPPETSIELAEPWTRVEPETVGIDEGEIFVAGELAGRIDRLRSLLVVREGRLAFERYYGGFTADSLADVRSVTKSVMSLLVGVAIEEGHIRSLDQSITEFLLPPNHPVRLIHTVVTVRDLLTMSGGFDWTESGALGYGDWIQADDRIAYLLDRELVAAPGGTFNYNSAAVHLLGVLLEEATGVGVPAYADRVLFTPLGIRAAEWESFEDGRVNGSSGLDLRPRDLARLGQLVLQEGWSGRRPIVPAPWVERATERYFPDVGGVGFVGRVSFGFLWWVDLERDAFFAWGYGGQFVYVVPDRSLVVVATTDWRGLSADIGSERLQQEVLRVIVDRVLPAAR